MPVEPPKVAPTSSFPLKAMHALDQLMVWVGEWVLTGINVVVEYVRFNIRTLTALPKVFKNFHLTMEQMHSIGISSIPLVATTNLFTGAVTAWQAGYMFADIIPVTYIGVAVGKSVILELGPVLTALVVAGRTGAGMTSELGSMAVTEQLDAMEVLGLDRYRFLVAPRMMASLIMLPVLTIVSSLVGLMGALGVSLMFKEMEPNIFWKGVRLFYRDRDVWISLIKAMIFGFVLSSYGCFSGCRARNGAEGVGHAIEHSVQASAVTILIMNFLVGYIMLRM
jgi:phospholipid/cholesterol/gamma-HCH transport system permease protein